MALKSSELVLSDGKVYHLDLSPEQISETIILVGDQFRVPKVSAHFDEILHQVQKREFACHTGIYKGKKLSVVSTGIGTDNVDIVLNELDALFNIDLENRKTKEKPISLNFVRIGTCGAMHKDTPVGSYILSSGSFGLDNVAHFYEIEKSSEEKENLNLFMKLVGFPATIQPYYTNADPDLNALLRTHPKVKEGMTVTASGFYGPQGRRLRLPLKISDLNSSFASYTFKDRRIENFEMESSAIFALARGLGHNAATICLALANRESGEFLSSYDSQMDELIQYVLQQLSKYGQQQ